MKTLRTAVLLAALAILATAGIALAAHPAKTRISIDDKGIDSGFGGYVHSSKYKCESNRKVRLYKMTGRHRRPSRDIKIGSDVAQPNGPDSQYFIDTTTTAEANSGSFYVYAKAKRGCRRGLSRVQTRAEN